ncbi:MAG: hypothetical protein J6386_01180 [Candidatus Synoicihabitans palmerolidicus]|nr:hypothetical protein [Candidatus Synoicihabitans palmerolidicus]
MLTKINVGAFWVIGTGVWALRSTRWPGTAQRLAPILATLGAIALPWFLMAGNLSDSRIFVFALQFSFGAAALVWVTPDLIPII